MKTIFIFLIVIASIWIVASTVLWLFLAAFDHKKLKFKDWVTSLLMPIGLVYHLFKKKG